MTAEPRWLEKAELVELHDYVIAAPAAPLGSVMGAVGIRSGEAG